MDIKTDDRIIWNINELKAEKRGKDRCDLIVVYGSNNYACIGKDLDNEKTKKFIKTMWGEICHFNCTGYVIDLNLIEELK